MSGFFLNIVDNIRFFMDLEIENTTLQQWNSGNGQMFPRVGPIVGKKVHAAQHLGHNDCRYLEFVSILGK